LTTCSFNRLKLLYTSHVIIAGIQSLEYG